MAYFYLGIAILAEVVGTTALKASNEFTNLMPTLIMILGYSIGFYFMTLSIRTIPIGISYALWSGIGIVLIVIAGIFFYQQIPDLAAIVGMALIITGVLVIYLFSNTVKG